MKSYVIEIDILNEYVGSIIQLNFLILDSTWTTVNVWFLKLGLQHFLVI